MNNYYNTSFKKAMGHNLICIDPISIDNASNTSINYTNDFRIKMIVNNNIKGILPTHLEFVNNTPSFCYNITGLQSLSIILESRPLDYNLLCRLICEIYNTLLACEDYMLDIDKLLFKPENLFLSPDYSSIGLCYLPFKEESFSFSLTHLFDYLLKNVNHKDEKCVYVTYSLHNHCLNNDITPNSLISFISSDPSETNYYPEAKPQISQPYNYKSTNQSAHNTAILPNANNINSDYFTGTSVNTKTNITYDNNNHINNHQITNQKPQNDNLLYNTSTNKNDNKLGNDNLIKIGLLGITLIIGIVLISCLFIFNFIDTTLLIILVIIILITCGLIGFNIYKNLEGPISVLLHNDTPSEDLPSFYLEDNCGTILLSSSENNDSHMLIATNSDINSQITLNHYPFTIGKNTDCDLVIQNPIISRLHCRIGCKTDDNNLITYYIEDLNSTNGTSLNGASILPYKQYTLVSGDNISFGHLTYIFR